MHRISCHSCVSTLPASQYLCVAPPEVSNRPAARGSFRRAPLPQLHSRSGLASPPSQSSLGPRTFGDYTVLPKWDGWPKRARGICLRPESCARARRHSRGLQSGVSENCMARPKVEAETQLSKNCNFSHYVHRKIRKAITTVYAARKDRSAAIRRRAPRQSSSARRRRGPASSSWYEDYYGARRSPGMWPREGTANLPRARWIHYQLGARCAAHASRARAQWTCCYPL